MLYIKKRHLLLERLAIFKHGVKCRTLKVNSSSQIASLRILRLSLLMSLVSPPCLFQVPSLIVYGDQDSQLGELSLRNLSNLANHSVVVMKGAGHPCYLDDPDTWHKALTDFLNRL